MMSMSMQKVTHKYHPSATAFVNALSSFRYYENDLDRSISQESVFKFCKKIPTNRVLSRTLHLSFPRHLSYKIEKLMNKMPTSM